MRMFLLLLATVAGSLAPVPSAGPEPGVDLRQETLDAFAKYIKGVEAEVDLRVSGKKNFLWLDDVPARRAGVRANSSEPVTARTSGDRPVEVQNGLVHDFIGGVFIPGATVARTLAFVQDYDHHEDFYGPEVVDARIVSRDGDHFVIFMRLKKSKAGVTAVLNTTHDAQFYQLDSGRWHSRSKTTKVTEVKNAGSREERELPVGEGSGYMWALNSYWRFLERDGGTYVECQAVSLSRSIPWLPPPLSWIVKWIVNDLPRVSLANTLAATKAGVLKRVPPT